MTAFSGSLALKEWRIFVKPLLERELTYANYDVEAAMAVDIDIWMIDSAVQFIMCIFHVALYNKCSIIRQAFCNRWLLMICSKNQSIAHLSQI